MVRMCSFVVIASFATAPRTPPKKVRVAAAPHEEKAGFYDWATPHKETSKRQKATAVSHPALRPERRDVRSRRYVFPDGIVAAVSRSRRWKDAAAGGGGAFEDEHAGFLVELSVKVADANLEAAAKQGLLRARETLAPALHPVGK